MRKYSFSGIVEQLRKKADIPQESESEILLCTSPDGEVQPDSACRMKRCG